MQALRRHSLSVIVALALVLVAGPAAMAACPHAESGEVPHETMPMAAATDAGAMDHGGEAAMPCHDDPGTESPEAPAPDENADCLSPCCTIDVPATAPPAPAVPTATVVVVLADTPLVRPAHRDAPALDLRDTGPPEPPARLHLLLERFLT